MGSCLTKKEYVGDFEMEFDFYGGLTIRNRYSGDILFDGEKKDIVSQLKDVIFTIDNFVE